ncbi:hypothetical protein GB881_12855, partial [Georgenia subflava]
MSTTTPGTGGDTPPPPPPGPDDTSRTTTLRRSLADRLQGDGGAGRPAGTAPSASSAAPAPA